MATFIDLHILQTLPPSNVNRDDTGAPKSAVYGGFRRARVSSQAWKRATRMAFRHELPESALSVRTTRVVTALAERIVAMSPEHPPEVAAKLAEGVFKAMGLKTTAPRAAKAREGSEPREQDLNPRSDYLVFLSSTQLDALAELALAAERGEKKLDRNSAKAAARRGHGVDIAMFGRMIADDSELRVDAAVQVAHAISVHEVDTEYDYFTAVDDNNVDDAGAGMIGTVEFNASTLYRYATINVDGLQRNLGDADATAAAAAAFVRCFTTSMPTGKQATFANRTLPAGVVVQVRSGQPVNLVGAFEDPVTGSVQDSRLKVAATRLALHAREVDEAYGTQPSASFIVSTGAATEPLLSLGERVNLDELVTAVRDQVRSVVHAPVGS